MIIFVRCSGVVALAFSFVAQTFAQNAGWQAKAKIANGQCPDGVIVFVTEQPGRASLNMTSGGRPGTKVDVALGPDGSGSTEFNGYMGPTRLEIGPGTGKRPIKTASLDGKCTWTWQ